MAGAHNELTGEFGNGINFLTGVKDTHPNIAKQYKAAGQDWVIFGDENYGEGSSREHAAMEPRHKRLPCCGRSQLRPHPRDQLEEAGRSAPSFSLTHADYDKVKGDDVVAIEGIARIADGGSPTVVLTHADGSVDRIETTNTLSMDQFVWFKSGSALNKIRADFAAAAK